MRIKLKCQNTLLQMVVPGCLPLFKKGLIQVKVDSRLYYGYSKLNGVLLIFVIAVPTLPSDTT